MPRHSLQAVTPVAGLEVGHQNQYFIQKQSDGRFGLMSASREQFYKVFTLEELSECFSEFDEGEQKWI